MEETLKAPEISIVERHVCGTNYEKYGGELEDRVADLEMIIKIFSTHDYATIVPVLKDMKLYDRYLTVIGSEYNAPDYKLKGLDGYCCSECAKEKMRKDGWAVCIG